MLLTVVSHLWKVHICLHFRTGTGRPLFLTVTCLGTLPTVCCRCWPFMYDRQQQQAETFSDFYYCIYFYYWFPSVPCMPFCFYFSYCYFLLWHVPVVLFILFLCFSIYALLTWYFLPAAADWEDRNRNRQDYLYPRTYLSLLPLSPLPPPSPFSLPPSLSLPFQFPVPFMYINMYTCLPFSVLLPLFPLYCATMPSYLPSVTLLPYTKCLPYLYSSPACWHSDIWPYHWLSAFHCLYLILTFILTFNIFPFPSLPLHFSFCHATWHAMACICVNLPAFCPDGGTPASLLLCLFSLSFYGEDSDSDRWQWSEQGRKDETRKEQGTRSGLGRQPPFAFLALHRACSGWEGETVGEPLPPPWSIYLLSPTSPSVCCMYAFSISLCVRLVERCGIILLVAGTPACLISSLLDFVFFWFSASSIFGAGWAFLDGAGRAYDLHLPRIGITHSDDPPCISIWSSLSCWRDSLLTYWLTDDYRDLISSW